MLHFWIVHSIRNQEILDRFADRFREVRKSKKLSQEDVAYMSGLSVSQIARIEIGKLNTSVCTLMILATALGVDAGELLRFPVSDVVEIRPPKPEKSVKERRRVKPRPPKAPD